MLVGYLVTVALARTSPLGRAHAGEVTCELRRRAGRQSPAFANVQAP